MAGVSGGSVHSAAVDDSRAQAVTVATSTAADDTLAANNSNESSATAVASADAAAAAARKSAQRGMLRPNPTLQRLRLSRPGSPSVQVVPSLLGMDEVSYACKACRQALFATSNIVRTNTETASSKAQPANAGAESWGWAGTEEAEAKSAVSDADFVKDDDNGEELGYGLGRGA